MTSSTYFNPVPVTISEPVGAKYFQRVVPIIARAKHRAMIAQTFDFEEVLVVAPPPLAEGRLGFAAKIGISFAYRLMQWRWRDRDEYTDLDGRTQQFVVGHWSIVISHSPWGLRNEAAMTND
jgi:hypothetical protein